ncbi:hypothetical protein AAWM_00168 [Aspergillus awamori]|uniref:Nucleoside phosphorylase domain-containing protein n=1 Tax=Aspergillus awamori TaxID=105351 RepID=A0A401KD91_ASPAW|nr:hypothetical protein AAWM_00168 [Aspergillus awamori]GKZ56232.1 hypothetical protein AnigIFM49718_001457 [Aspergillus niger]
MPTILSPKSSAERRAKSSAERRDTRSEDDIRREQERRRRHMREAGMQREKARYQYPEASHEQAMNNLDPQGHGQNAYPTLPNDAQRPADSIGPELELRTLVDDSGYGSTTTKRQELSRSRECDVSLGQTEQTLQNRSTVPLQEKSANDGSDVTANTYNKHDNDDQTIDSGPSSPPESVKETYIAEIAEDIAKATRPFQPNAEVLQRISEVLPMLLKTFALGLGHAKSSQMHRDVMVFLHEHRMDIGAALLDRLGEHADQEGEESDFALRTSGKMPLDEMMLLWHSKVSPEPSEGPYEPPETIFNQDDEHIGSERSETSTEVRLPQMDAYRNLIRNSPSYSWLVDILRRECVLAPSEPNAMELIRDMVLSFLPIETAVSRRRPTQVFEVFVRMNWDPVAFYIQQEYTENPKEAIERAITLTGSRRTTQAVTCSQYMSQTWPSTGVNILELVTSLVSSDHNTEHGNAKNETDHRVVVLPDGTTLQALRQATKDQPLESCVVWIKISGLADSIAEVGEQLAWLGCALRSSPADSGIAYCRPFVKRLREGLVPEDLGLNPLYVYEIGFDIQTEEGNTESVNGCCWHGLFRNPVVAEGYPTPRRPEPDPGLEIPLGLLAGLSQVRRATTFDGKTVLKGFSVMLIPTKFSNDIVMWHMLHADSDKRLSYLEAQPFAPISITGADLEKSRHLLGWCSDMKFYAGTSEARYTVQGSRLQYPTGKSALANVSISIGHLIRGGTPFSVGTKDLHPRRTCYVTKMRWISQRFLVLWDVEAKRGWLVNGASALLHLLRASLEQERRSKFGRRLLFNPDELQEAAEPYRHESALDVLLSESNMKLRIYAEKNDFICFQDRIEDFYDHLETIFDYQLRSDYSQVHRSCLDGWDFHDLATEKDPVYPRRAKIDPEGSSWIDLTRSIHAVTLLGRGYGEIIRPNSSICPSWASLPEGKSYLAASLADLRDIMEAYGGDPYGTPVRLTNSLVWYMIESTAMECRCLELRGNCHSDLAQVILPSTLIRDLGDSFTAYKGDKGAVFFGFNSKHQWYWKDHGKPSRQETGADHVSTPENGSSYIADSGVGSAEITSSEGSGISGPTVRQSRNGQLEMLDSTSTLSTSQEKGDIPPREYSIGIICALPLELKAVRALFDETHPECILNADTHAYALGRIGRHRVVAAGLPKGGYGTTYAAVVACNMRRSFPSIEFCLLVGIGGGVPSRNHDIRLGDIVVSTPSGPHPGVLAYDSVKMLEAGEVQPNACLSRPSQSLLSAITALTSETKSALRELQEALDQITASCPGYGHPGSGQDILFASEYIHKANETRDSCERCVMERQVVRSPRESTQPHIHYGLIASGNQLMRSAQVRDQMSQKYDILCFEMEGAGIMDTLPSLVIRGICDYADSHKNKRWQKYAAATAAAYAKLLLSRVRTVSENDAKGSLLTGCNRKLWDGVQHFTRRQLVENEYRES